MSGHSKWAKIKRAKGANDAKRGQLFTKIANQISIAAREGGGDPEMNFTLRLAIEKAKNANMPSASVDKAIDRGTGKSKESMSLQHITYEAIGPGNAAVLIDCLTDNQNRTYSNVKNIVENLGGTIASPNSVAWQFEEKGLITVRSAKITPSEKFGAPDMIVEVNSDELELELFDIPGIENIEETEIETEEGTFQGFEIYVNHDDLYNVRTKVDALKVKIESAELIKEPTQGITLEAKDEEKLQRFIEEIEGDEDVENVWTNA
ncbi:YebC/PmpR family DNA-binding transcriptional regulator [Candidatus Dojkabacteria bacterium]|uniref:Probable transcriptional regulatory protein KC660_01975 n=1 Tax=Candidatus Dojkabacteria bacterium TaxID=2099670 RepID=A0A955RI31_9BACT|nr:YebC/PmpR family DNA-binding transcriptional regulator [Candidatus Dojkabacteria bacterium]